MWIGRHKLLPPIRFAKINEINLSNKWKRLQNWVTTYIENSMFLSIFIITAINNMFDAMFDEHTNH